MRRESALDTGATVLSAAQPPSSSQALGCFSRCLPLSCRAQGAAFCAQACAGIPGECTCGLLRALVRAPRIVC